FSIRSPRLMVRVMATSANTVTTIDRRLRRPTRASVAHRVLMISVAVGLIVTVVATVRLAAVTLATPTEVWLDEYPTLLDPAVKVDPRAQSWAGSLSAIAA